MDCNATASGSASQEHDKRKIPSTLSGRARRFPAHFKDFIPPKNAPIPLPAPSPLPSPTNSPREVSAAPGIISPDLETITTEPNSFGLYRVYSQIPTVDPEEAHDLNNVCDAPDISVPQISAAKSLLSYIHENYFSPFISATHYRLLSWFYNGNTTKSAKDLDDLVQQVLLAEDFDREDLRSFRAAQELKKLDDHMNRPSNLLAEDGWIEGSVKIRLPCTRVKVKSEEEAPEFLVEPVYYRRLTQVLVSSFQEPAAKLFHYIPFKLFWKPTADSPPERVLSEIYNSDAMIAEHEKIQSQPNEPGCDLEKAIAAALVFSDSTHLTNFGVASLWPGYVLWGNQTKYERSKPSSFAAHHFVYMQSVRFFFYYPCSELINPTAPG